MYSTKSKTYEKMNSNEINGTSKKRKKVLWCMGRAKKRRDFTQGAKTVSSEDKFTNTELKLKFGQSSDASLKTKNSISVDTVDDTSTLQSGKYYFSRNSSNKCICTELESEEKETNTDNSCFCIKCNSKATSTSEDEDSQRENIKSTSTTYLTTLTNNTSSIKRNESRTIINNCPDISLTSTNKRLSIYSIGRFTSEKNDSARYPTSAPTSLSPIEKRLKSKKIKYAPPKELKVNASTRTLLVTDENEGFKTQNINIEKKDVATDIEVHSTENKTTRKGSNYELAKMIKASGPISIVSNYKTDDGYMYLTFRLSSKIVSSSTESKVKNLISQDTTQKIEKHPKVSTKMSSMSESSTCGPDGKCSQAKREKSIETNNEHQATKDCNDNSIYYEEKACQDNIKSDICGSSLEILKISKDSLQSVSSLNKSINSRKLRGDLYDLSDYSRINLPNYKFNSKSDVTKLPKDYSRYYKKEHFSLPDDVVKQYKIFSQNCKPTDFPKNTATADENVEVTTDCSVNYCTDISNPFNFDKYISLDEFPSYNQDYEIRMLSHLRGGADSAAAAEQAKIEEGNQTETVAPHIIPNRNRSTMPKSRYYNYPLESADTDDVVVAEKNIKTTHSKPEISEKPKTDATAPQPPPPPPPPKPAPGQVKKVQTSPPPSPTPAPRRTPESETVPISAVTPADEAEWVPYQASCQSLPPARPIQAGVINLPKKRPSQIEKLRIAAQEDFDEGFQAGFKLGYADGENLCPQRYKADTSGCGEEPSPSKGILSKIISIVGPKPECKCTPPLFPEKSPEYNKGFLDGYQTGYTMGGGKKPKCVKHDEKRKGKCKNPSCTLQKKSSIGDIHGFGFNEADLSACKHSGPKGTNDGEGGACGGSSSRTCGKKAPKRSSKCNPNDVKSGLKDDFIDSTLKHCGHAKEKKDDAVLVCWALTRVSMYENGTKAVDVVDVSSHPPGHFYIDSCNKLHVLSDTEAKNQGGKDKSSK